MQGTSRKKLLVAAAAAAAVLLMAGSAYACTVYKGKVTLTATGSGDTAEAHGKGGVHEYCSGSQTQTVDMNATNQFSLALAPTTAACGGSQLPIGTYEVRWVNMTGSNTVLNNGNAPWVYNCNVTASNVLSLGSLTVNNSGVGSGSFQTAIGGPFGTATPSNGASGAVNLCVVPGLNNPTSDSAPELALWVI